jgi:hypothetical protein
MKIVIVYRDESDYAREVLDYIRDFNRQTGHMLPTLDPDSSEGAELCRTYDIVEYPSVLATTDNGILQNMWRGLPLPTISELSFYV